MFLSGTALNVVAVLLGSAMGLVLGARMPPRLQESLTTGLGFFTVVIGLSMALPIFTDPATPPGNELAVLAALLVGVALGELLRLSDRLDALGAWFERRLSRGTQPRPISEGFVTASLVFCVGPLTILGSIQNGLSGDITLLAVKRLLDGVASVAFAAALGPGVALSALSVLVIQGSIAGAAALLQQAFDTTTVTALTAVGGLILLGVALRLLDLKAVRVANFLPALALAPVFVSVAALIRSALP